jgi:SWI/SNF-related matrix-associated actin-dependent regulator of chromatin subfamily A3
MAEQPAALSTVLLPYQRQGLQWMVSKETPVLPQTNSSEPVQLWKKSHGMYTNIATNFSVSKGPDLASGGILADDMGLGKTLQVISVIIADPKKTKQPTLIVSPLSVMSNWKHQADFHIKEKYRPRVLIYHGPENRGLSPAEFCEYDLVITTCESFVMRAFTS